MQHTQLWQQQAAQQPRSSLIARSFDGNATKELQEAAKLDELIDMLMAAKNEQELSRVVAENIFSFDPKFWLRVATRNDSMTDEAQKDRLRAVADSVMILVDTMVKQTEQQLNDSASVLQEILKAAADERGEWYLPLEPAQVAAVRAALDKYSERLDEALLSNCFAWMKKCQDDRMDTMVTLLQKILQLYASKALKGPETTGPEGVLNQVRACLCLCVYLGRGRGSGDVGVKRGAGRWGGGRGEGRWLTRALVCVTPPHFLSP